MKKSSTQSSDSSISEPEPIGLGSEIFFAQNRNPLAPAPKIALVASIAWTLWNYRLALIHALEQAGYEVVLIAGDDASRLKLERHTRTKFFPLKHINRSSLSPFANLRLLFELYRSLRRVKPDVVCLFTIRPNTLGNFAAAALGIPAISTIEGMGISGSNKWWLRKLMLLLYRLAFRSAKKVIFLNKDDYQEFVEKQVVHPSKSLLIPGPGINLEHFSPRKKQQKSKGIVFLFVARLLSEKGIREFAQAARIIKSEGHHAKFRVLGSTDSGNPTSIEAVELTQWINEGILQYDGFVDDVRPAIAEADVLVLPSYYREGVPRSVLEGMAMGKMIITTESVGCRDTVEDEGNGYLVPPRDAGALAEAIKKTLALSDAQIQAMGQKSREKVEREFSDGMVLPRYLELVRGILDGKP